MRLHHGVTVEQAIRVLTERISDSQQASGSTAAGPDVKRQLYLNWVNATQQQLRTVFSETDLEDSLLGRGYWHICTTMRYDRSRKNLDRHPNYILAAYMASGT